MKTMEENYLIFQESVKVTLGDLSIESPCERFKQTPRHLLDIHQYTSLVSPAMGNGPVLQNLVTMEDVWDAYGDNLREVECQIHKGINSEAPLINTVAGQILSSGGKRIRPLLLILCAQLCGYLQKEYLSLGSLIEFIHTATLLHDDVLDEADLRRGQKTARRIWGNQASILVGDYLYSRAMYQIAAFHNHGFNEVLADACSKMTEGEVLQLCANNRPDITEAEYIQIVEYKTATLVAAACKIGAMVGGASPDGAGCAVPVWIELRHGLSTRRRSARLHGRGRTLWQVVGTRPAARDDDPSTSPSFAILY